MIGLCQDCFKRMQDTDQKEGKLYTQKEAKYCKLINLKT